MVFTSREIDIIKHALNTEASRIDSQFPAKEITALLERLEKKPTRYYHLDWFGNPHEI
jgi:hypothetical protein